MIDHLYAALHTPLGLVVEFTDADRARQRLYAERKKDPALSVLSLTISPVNSAHIWIVKKGNGDAEG